MTNKPKALELANWLLQTINPSLRNKQAAAELRRLHEVNAELLNALEMVRDADDDCKRDLLPTITPMARSKIDAAIAKSKSSEA